MIPNGTFTIRSPRGEHRTFKVRAVKNGGLAGKRVVGLLTGPDNGNDFESFGFVDGDRVRIFRRFVAARGDKPTHFQWFGKMVETLVGGNGNVPFPGFEVKASRSCVRCNRLLTTPESIAAGIGPECATR